MSKPVKEKYGEGEILEMMWNYGKYHYTDEYVDIPLNIRNEMNENANLHYSESYFEFVNKYYEKAFYFFSNNAILVLEVHKKLFFHFVILPSEPFIFSNDSEDAMQEFMDSFVAMCKKMKVDWIGPTEATALFQNSPTDSLRIPFGSYVIDLSLNMESLWSNIHSKHRNVIRNAEKKGVQIAKGGVELLDDYVQLDRDTWARSGRKSEIRDFGYKLLNDLSEYTKIYIAYYEQEPQSGAIFLRNREMSYYMFGASRNNPLTGAANLLHWTAIKDAKNLGIKRYSFVGCRINEDPDSKYHGIQRFKGRFGGPLLVGEMFKVILRPRKYNLYRQLKRIRDGRPSLDIIDQELYKWRE